MDTAATAEPPLLHTNQRSIRTEGLESTEHEQNVLEGLDSRILVRALFHSAGRNGIPSHQYVFDFQWLSQKSFLVLVQNG